MRGASSRCGCHRYRHPSSPPPPRRTSERRTNRALECGFPREEECEGHQQGGNRRDRTRAYATTLKMPRGLLAGLPRGLRERAQPERCPLPLPPLPLEAGLLGQHCVGKRSGGWNLFIISTSIHIETPALISNLPISKTGWAYQVQRGLIRLEIYLTHFPQFRLKLASSLFNCELLRV